MLPPTYLTIMLRKLVTFSVLILSTMLLEQAIQAWFVEQTDDGDSDTALSVLVVHVINHV
jgi:hypothetical protein